MKLIDTDVLFAQMKEYHEKLVEEANMTGNRTVCVTWQDAIILIKNTPTVDAVPVIRCKDCKFHHDRTQCKKRIGAWFDDDYCNGAVRAERKEE